MGDVSSEQPQHLTVDPLPPEVEALAARRLTILLGAVPLWQMDQEETDWLFRAKLRMADDE